MPMINAYLFQPSAADLQVPIVGRWSDVHGRRPFVGMFLTIASVPPILMAAHVNLGMSLYYYFPAEVSHVLENRHLGCHRWILCSRPCSMAIAGMSCHRRDRSKLKACTFAAYLLSCPGQDLHLRAVAQWQLHSQ